MGPAGTAHVTLQDYARFMLLHLTPPGRDSGLLTAATLETLHRVVSQDYALGWWRRPFNAGSGEVLTHDGTNELWYARVWIAPDRNAGAFIVTNCAQARGFTAIESLDMLIRRRVAATR
jgi:hypothetical protein